LTRPARLSGQGRRNKRRRKTTVPGPEAEFARDLIPRHFGPTIELDARYVHDVTYRATWKGWTYLVTMLDAPWRRCSTRSPLPP
jgi:transposase InsO family protein